MQIAKCEGLIEPAHHINILLIINKQKADTTEIYVQFNKLLQNEYPGEYHQSRSQVAPWTAP